MVVELMLIALILVLCIIADKFSGKFGMPALILFIGIGMLFGSDGIVKIPFDNFADLYDCTGIYYVLRRLQHQVEGG